MQNTMVSMTRSCRVPTPAAAGGRRLHRTSCVRAASTGEDERSGELDVLLRPASYASLTRLPLISRISALVEHKAMVQKFELVAARSAMLGISFTLLFEELGGGRVIEMNREQGELFAASLLLAVSAAGSLAFMRRRGGLGGRLLLEGVLSSLTSVGRSASSLTSTTPGSLDANVDLVVDAAFDREMTEWLNMSNDKQ